MIQERVRDVMVTAIRVQISHCTNILWKGMNSPNLSPTMGK